jgi:hypothetical protein
VSVAKTSYCEMGERCKLYDPETKKSEKLGRYHKRTICDRCWNAGYNSGPVHAAPGTGPRLDYYPLLKKPTRPFLLPLFTEVPRSRILGSLHPASDSLRALVVSKGYPFFKPPASGAAAYLDGGSKPARRRGSPMYQTLGSNCRSRTPAYVPPDLPMPGRITPNYPQLAFTHLVRTLP